MIFCPSLISQNGSTLAMYTKLTIYEVVHWSEVCNIDGSRIIKLFYPKFACWLW